MTQQELRDYTLRKLGYPVTVVELTPEQVDTAIADAFGKFNQYLCVGEPRLLSNRTGSVRVRLGEQDRGVLYCSCLIPRDYVNIEQTDIFQILYRMVFPRLPLGDWYMMKSFYKMYQEVRGTDPDWYFDDSTHSLYVDCTSGPYDVFYVVSQDLTITDFPKMKQAYQQDLRELIVAESKIILARIRGKFGGSIPVPGGTLQTDAAELKSEGESKKAEIEAKLDQIARFSVSPITWG